VISEPLLACGEWRRLRVSRVPTASPAAILTRTSGSCPEAITVCAPERAAALGREHFGEHAALGNGRAGSARYFLEPRLAGLSLPYQRGLRIASRIVGIESLLVGEDDEAVGLDQIGHQRAERIVVAEPDFLGNDGVVLVDHGNDAESKQRQQGGAGNLSSAACRRDRHG